MGRSPCCDAQGVKKGAWTPEEDQILIDFIRKNGQGRWRSLPMLAGLQRCGKSCRLRWTNYLRPGIKRGPFTPEEENCIIQLHSMLGNRWAAIASQIPGRTDNEIKNFWNTHLKKRLDRRGLDPKANQTSTAVSSSRKLESPFSLHMVQWESARVEAEARLSMESLLAKRSSPKQDSDFFLRLWHSEVGESFRSIKKIDGATQCQSRTSQTSSSAKCGSVSSVTMQPGCTMVSPPTDTVHMQENVEQESHKPTAEEAIATSDTPSSNEWDDYSDTTLELLLDIPYDDLSFIP